MKKWNRKPGKNAGFTLIEMLIVVAIIAVLVAVSIPLLTNELEKSRDRTDEANERAAKSAANLVWLGAIDNHEPGDQGIFYYDAAAGKLIDIDGPAPEPYGKCKVAHEERFVGGDGPHDTDHSNGYLTVKIKEGEITMSWGSLEDTATPTCGCVDNCTACGDDCPGCSPGNCSCVGCPGNIVTPPSPMDCGCGGYKPDCTCGSGCECPECEDEIEIPDYDPDNETRQQYLNRLKSLHDRLGTLGRIFMDMAIYNDLTWDEYYFVTGVNKFPWDRD